MTAKELSECYFKGVSRAITVLETLYEDLHDNSGNPLDDFETVKQKAADAIKHVRAELDIIKTAAEEKQGNDDHYIP